MKEAYQLTKEELTEQTILELEEMKNTCSELFTSLTENSDNNNLWHHNIMSMEQKMDDMTVLFRENMYKRIREGKCTDEGCVVYTEILTDFERIGDHALNIADEILRINRF